MSFIYSPAGAPSDDPFGANPSPEPQLTGQDDRAGAPLAITAPLADAVREEADFRLFVGGNADAFLRAWEALREKSWSWRLFCWPGFLLPPAWLLYRKMYGLAALTILLPVILSLIHLPVELTRWLGLGVSLLGAMGKRLYVAKARRTIAEIRAAAPDEAAARATIERAGGVSVAGAVIGVLLIGAFLVFAMSKK